MLNALGWLLKATLFAAIVLVASHLITWNGKSVSDQVRSGLSSAERAVPAGSALKSVKRKSRSLVEDAREAASKIGVVAPSARGARAKRGDSGKARSEREDVPVRDVEELQALIHSSDAA